MIRFTSRLIVFIILTAPRCLLSQNYLTFTDDDLSKYLKKNPSGIIYIISPRMVLSLKGYTEYKRIALKNNIPFLVLRDPLNNDNSVLTEIDIKNIPILKSKELLKRGATIHYPTFTFYKNGKLPAFFNPGYDEPQKFEARVRKEFL